MSAEINFNIPENKKSDRDRIAVVYARYSSHSQTEQSIEGQLAAARAYATAHDYTIVTSTSTGRRAGAPTAASSFRQCYTTQPKNNSA